MARGKHSERSENRKIKTLEEKLQNQQTELTDAKINLAQARKELLHYKSLDEVFSQNSDWLGELEKTRDELKIVKKELTLLRKKLLHYAKTMALPQNANLKFSQEMLADLADLGLLDDTFKDNREHRRQAKNGAALKKGFAKSNQYKKMAASQGFTL